MKTQEKKESKPKQKSQAPEPLTTETDEPVLALAETDKIQPPTISAPSRLLLPLAVVIAGALVGAGIFGGFVYYAKQVVAQKNEIQNPGETAGAITVKSVTASDHIQGSKDAKVTLITYSDLDCPYCQQAHATFKKLLSIYKPEQLAVVYRHFPLVNLHPTALRKAEAAECVANLGGNTAFWSFVDVLFANPSGIKTDNQLSQAAGQIGVSKNEFLSCLVSEKYRGVVEAQAKDAVAAGGGGTPYNILISGTTNIPISGSLPQSYFQQQIDALLK